MCGLIHCQYMYFKISRPVRINVKGCSLVFVPWFILRHRRYLTLCDFTETLVAYLRHSPRIPLLGEGKEKSVRITGVGRDSNRHLPVTRLESEPIHTTAWLTGLHWRSVKLSCPCFRYSELIRGRFGLLISDVSKERTDFIFKNVGWLLYPCSPPWPLKKKRVRTFETSGTAFLVLGVTIQNILYVVSTL